MSFFENTPTLYINLDSRPDRNTHVIAELQKIGCVAPERVAAIEMKSGALGCALSHLKCLNLAVERGWSRVFICEDDITFLDPVLLVENTHKFCEVVTAVTAATETAATTAETTAASTAESTPRPRPIFDDYNLDFDVLVIGGNNCPPYNTLSPFHIRVYNCQTTTGYVVTRRYYDTLIANIKEGIHKYMQALAESPREAAKYSIDIYWKLLQRDTENSRWYMIIPATVIQYENFSNIENCRTNYAAAMLDIKKDWLFDAQTAAATTSNSAKIMKMKLT